MQGNEVKKERKPMTPEQIEALKVRLMKAREAKVERDKKRYEFNKEEVKKEAIKKRALNKVKNLVDAGTLKEEEVTKVLPGSIQSNKEEDFKEINLKSPDIIPFEEPLPSSPITIQKVKKIPDVIPFEEPLPKQKKNKEKDRFLKIVYYKEPSKSALKKLQKINESSSGSDDDSSDVENNNDSSKIHSQDDYYRSLARQFFN